MNMTAVDAPRIAIVGGGIGGLAAAGFLHQEGLTATVYEQAPQLSAVGAGLVIAPNAARHLRRLGALDDVRKTAVQLDIGWEFRRWENGTVLSSEDLAASCERLFGEQTYTAHRADLLAAIEARVPPKNIRLGRKCVGLETVGQVTRLLFDTGETADADIVIGADGVHSIVRNSLFGNSPASYSGMCAFRALVPADQAPDFTRRPAQTLWIGPGRHLVHYPVSSGELVNLVAFAPAGDFEVESWTSTATVDEFLSEFDGWDVRLRDLIRASERPGCWALLDRAPLTRWSDQGVTLLGDAAHPMFPFFAQGAAQAIEDATVLARCLAENPHDPNSALERYSTLRIPRTTRLQEVSHARAEINHLPDGPEQQARDAAFAGEDPLLANAWIYSYDADQEPAHTGTAGL